MTDFRMGPISALSTFPCRDNNTFLLNGIELVLGIVLYGGLSQLCRHSSESVDCCDLTTSFDIKENDTWSSAGEQHLPAPQKVHASWALPW